MRGSVIQSKQTPLLVLSTSTVLVSVIGFNFSSGDGAASVGGAAGSVQQPTRCRLAQT